DPGRGLRLVALLQQRGCYATVLVARADRVQRLHERFTLRPTDVVLAGDEEQQLRQLVIRANVGSRLEREIQVRRRQPVLLYQRAQRAPQLVIRRNARRRREVGALQRRIGEIELRKSNQQF